ncbi:MAG TPA: MBL fold metallo-hydrolase, partial [Candidatus Solibacter sp.]|nr:MBL fold metallo-hydrolase [Candidatus Solibacter sp.]
MRAHLALTFLFAALSASAQTANLTITWIGQSCFVVRTAGGTTVVTDPPAASVGYTLPALSADAVTITHNHSDHNNVAAVTGATLVDGRPATARQQMNAAGTTFVLIPGFHDNQNGATRGPNTIIRWTQAGLNLVHLGDLGQEQFTDAQLADLENIDILFVPAGGFFTVTPAQAAGWVAQLKPKIAILMHYKTALGGPAQLAGLPDVATAFAPVVYKPSSVTVNPTALPSRNEVWVMQPAADSAAVNAASFAAGVPVAPGSIVSAFGSYKASQTQAASSFPLPRKLGETEVFVAGNAVPIYYASPGQLNFQVPAALAPGQALLEVRIGGQSVSRGVLTVVPSAPGVFLAANSDFRINSATQPVKRGEVLHIFGTGQGAVSPAV